MISRRANKMLIKPKTNDQIQNERRARRKTGINRIEDDKKNHPPKVPGKMRREPRWVPRQIDFVFVYVFQGCFWTFSGNVLGITCKIHSICIQRSWCYSCVDITLSSFNVASRCWSKLMYYMHRSPLFGLHQMHTRRWIERVSCGVGWMCAVCTPCDAARPTSRFTNGLIQNWIVKTLVLVWI